MFFCLSRRYLLRFHQERILLLPSAFVIILFGVIGVIAFVGFILFVVAMHRLSQYYNEPSIFKNTLYGFIVNIVGAITALLFYIALTTTVTHSVSSRHHSSSRCYASTNHTAHTELTRTNYLINLSLNWNCRYNWSCQRSILHAGFQQTWRKIRSR